MIFCLLCAIISPIRGISPKAGDKTVIVSKDFRSIKLSHSADNPDLKDLPPQLRSVLTGSVNESSRIFRFSVLNKSESTENLVINVPSAMFGSLSWLIDGENGVEIIQDGYLNNPDSVIFPAKRFPDLFFTLNPGEKTEIYAVVKPNGMTIPFALFAESAYRNENHLRGFYTGLFSGFLMLALIAAVIYNFFLPQIRTALFILFIINVLFFTAEYEGYIIPWAMPIQAEFIQFLILSYGYLFLRLQKEHYYFKYFTVIMGTVILSCFLYFLSADFSQSVIISQITYPLLFLFITAASAHQFLKYREKHILLYYLGVALQFLFAVTEMILVNSELQRSIISFTVLGSVSETIIIGFALIMQLSAEQKKLREEKNEALRNANEFQKKMIEKERFFLKSASRFVPDQFLEAIGKSDITVVQSGDAALKKMAVLFSDIRNFTKITEKMAPEKAFSLVNDYLNEMNPIIKNYNGFVDKYIGDAIMALYYSPDSAVRSAVEMIRLIRSNHNSGKSAISRSGIGIHYGPLMLGTIGNDQRLDTTVISDTVNTAARLESLTRDFGTDLLITAATASLCGDSGLIFRSLGRIRIKGKSDSVEVLEVLNIYDDFYLRMILEYEPLFQESLHFIQRGNYSEAAEGFEKILKINSEDNPAARMLKIAEKQRAVF